MIGDAGGARNGSRGGRMNDNNGRQGSGRGDSDEPSFFGFAGAAYGAGYRPRN